MKIKDVFWWSLLFMTVQLVSAMIYKAWGIPNILILSGIVLLLSGLTALFHRLDI